MPDGPAPMMIALGEGDMVLVHLWFGSQWKAILSSAIRPNICLMIDTYLSSVPPFDCCQSLAEGVTVFPSISVQPGRWIPVYGKASYIGDKVREDMLMRSGENNRFDQYL